jgi:hypothetical protein
LYYLCTASSLADLPPTRILRGCVRNQNVSVVPYHAAPPVVEAVRRAARAVRAEAILELAPLASTGTTIRSRS